jgi:hypothetical protein
MANQCCRFVDCETGEIARIPLVRFVVDLRLHWHAKLAYVYQQVQLPSRLLSFFVAGTRLVPETLKTKTTVHLSLASIGWALETNRLWGFRTGGMNQQHPLHSWQATTYKSRLSVNFRQVNNLFNNRHS